jgi:hypothetical protein
VGSAAFTSPRNLPLAGRAARTRPPFQAALVLTFRPGLRGAARSQMFFGICCPDLPTTLTFAPSSAGAPSAASEPWCNSKSCSPVPAPCRCWWIPHDTALSEPAATPTLPSWRAAAPVCADRRADPISAPQDSDSSVHSHHPCDPNSPPSLANPTIGSSGPIHTPPRTEAKPIKDRPSSCGLVHCTVYSVFAAMKTILLIGCSAPRNRANLFQ